MTPVENNLIDRIKNGDSSAETELITHYRDRIIAIVQQRIDTNNLYWEDICSEIQTAMLIRLRQGKYKPDKGSLSSYIYGIALNKIRDYFKEEKKQRSILDNQSLDKLADQSKHELPEKIREAIKTLKIKYKEVIYLRFYEGKSIAEIADHLQIESKRVSERIHYAITLLQKKC